MTGKRIIYYLLAAFIAGNVLLIYIQYSSAKNINILIDGNEKVLAEIDVTNNLGELNRNISSVTPYSADSPNQLEVNAKITKVQSEIDNLQKISDDDTSVKYIDVLDTLVQEKLRLKRNISDPMHFSGQDTTQGLNLSNMTKILNDSIRLVTHTIESSRQKLLTKVTSEIDASGKKALDLGTTLILLVLLTGAVLFWFIITAIRKQNHLIQKLNLSERKVKEVAQIKENFMANMSHEIRTPMNAILGFTNLLKRKNLDGESKEYVQTIERSGENLLTIINDILDLSKIEAGMMRIESAPFSIRGLMHSIENMLKPKADEKLLNLTFDIEEFVPDTLEGDATRLTQVLINLVGNALKFTSKGNISIKITNEGREGAIIKVGIIVSDTGIGINNEKLHHIFERFQQAEDSVTRKYGGSGLGLSIVNDIVLLQNGTINVESEPDKGSTFRVMIPYEISSGKFSATISPETNINIQHNFKNICILVAEDNEINQSLIKHLFKTWQLDFELVKNGKEAIEKLKTKSYDLILMDIQMPEMDGYTASLEIRYNLNLDTPIIAMTAHAMEGEREKCLSYGMNEYISKPIREDQLHKLIARYTPDNTTAVAEKEESISEIVTNPYDYINLKYMKEISLGDVEYERTVTEQFLEMVPDDLLAIEKAWQNNEINAMRQVAHNLKTTISVMGLNELLQPNLDSLEYDDLSEVQFQQKFAYMKFICNAALEEAKRFKAKL